MGTTITDEELLRRAGDLEERLRIAEVARRFEQKPARHLYPLPNVEADRREPAFAVQAACHSDRSGEPVDGNVRQQIVAGDGTLGFTGAVGP